MAPYQWITYGRPLGNSMCDTFKKRYKICIHDNHLLFEHWKEEPLRLTWTTLASGSQQGAIRAQSPQHPRNHHLHRHHPHPHNYNANLHHTWIDIFWFAESIIDVVDGGHNQNEDSGHEEPDGNVHHLKTENKLTSIQSISSEVNVVPQNPDVLCVDFFRQMCQRHHRLCVRVVHKRLTLLMAFVWTCPQSSILRVVVKIHLQRMTTHADHGEPKWDGDNTGGEQN